MCDHPECRDQKKLIQETFTKTQDWMKKVLEFEKQYPPESQGDMIARTVAHMVLAHVSKGSTHFQLRTDFEGEKLEAFITMIDGITERVYEQFKKTADLAFFLDQSLADKIRKEKANAKDPT